MPVLRSNQNYYLSRNGEPPMTTETMRTFHLVRNEDVTGNSGTGVVAEGVEFSDGTVALRWRGPIQQAWGLIEATTVLHPNVGNVEHLHGHDGATRIEWL